MTSVIIGAKTGEQLLDNIAATELQLSEQDMATLDTVSALPSEYPGWMLDRMSSDRQALLTGK